MMWLLYDNENAYELANDALDTRVRIRTNKKKIVHRCEFALEYDQ